jgi:hypothetical protein
MHTIELTLNVDQGRIWRGVNERDLMSQVGWVGCEQRDLMLEWGNQCLRSVGWGVRAVGAGE